MRSYIERLDSAENYLGRGEFEVCTILCGKAMELLLKDILEKYLNIADERQKIDVKDFLSARHKSSMITLTAGEIVTLYLKIKVIESLAKKLSLDMETFGLLNLREMVDIRNKATHTVVHDKMQEKSDAYVMYGNLIRLARIADRLLIESVRENKDTSKGTFQTPKQPTRDPRRFIVSKKYVVGTTPSPSESLTLLRNKSSGKHFIYLEDESSTKRLLVTPDGFIKGIDVNLFNEPIEMEERQAVDQQIVSEEQVRKYHDYVVTNDQQNEKIFPEVTRPVRKKILPRGCTVDGIHYNSASEAVAALKNKGKLKSSDIPQTSYNAHAWLADKSRHYSFIYKRDK